jgi:F-type H+-transporting ATPase subunit a
LALLVFFTVVIYGFYRHGFRFFRLFVPCGVPLYILPVIVVIEFLSFLTRPLTHSVRLFANMLAGHITLNVFGSFVVMLGAAGFLGWIGAVLPLGLTVMMTALELLVAVLQAYVFAILTCIYLGEAIHAGHGAVVLANDICPCGVIGTRAASGCEVDRTHDISALTDTVKKDFEGVSSNFSLCNV